jgi:Aspartyl protease
MLMKKDFDPSLSGIKFKINRMNPLLLVSTIVNGQGPLNFIVDTGASASVITWELANEMGIRVAKKRKTAVSATGQQEVGFARLKSLQISSVKMSRLEVAVMDLATVQQASRLHISGILGYDVLKHYRVIIDYPKKLIFFELGKSHKPLRKRPRPPKTGVA